MAVIDGKSMAVDGQKTIFGWQIDYDGNEAEYVASNTGGGVARKGGNRDWTGWYDAYGDTATPWAPTTFPGDSFTFTGTTETAKGATGTARCTRLVMLADLRPGGYVTYRVFFGANGALTIGAAAATDTTEPSPQHVAGLYCSLGGVQQSNVNFMQLMLTRGCRRYVSAECDGQYKRTEGDRMDVEGRWRVYEDTPANLPIVGQEYAAKFAVTPAMAQYWEINWLVIDEVRDLGVNRNKTDEPVYAEIVGRFVAENGTSAGSIVNPAGATKFP
jgi:hypothetical protein